MADKLTPAQRHKNMVAVKNKGTKPELILRMALWRKGLRYRKNYKGVPGVPDIAFVQKKLRSLWMEIFGMRGGIKSTRVRRLLQIRHSGRKN